MSCRMGKSMDRMEFPYGKYCPAGIYLWRNSKSSHRRFSVKEDVLRNFTKFTEKHLCQSLFFNEVAGLRPVTLLKKRLLRKCFPLNFVKFVRTFFCIELLWWLLVKISRQKQHDVVLYPVMLQFWAQLNIFSLAKFSISLCSVRMQENADQNNSEYGHFSRSVSIIHFSCLRPFDTHLKLVSAIFIKFLFFTKW